MNQILIATAPIDSYASTCGLPLALKLFIEPPPISIGLKPPGIPLGIPESLSDLSLSAF